MFGKVPKLAWFVGLRYSCFCLVGICVEWLCGRMCGVDASAREEEFTLAAVETARLVPQMCVGKGLCGTYCIVTQLLIVR